MSKKILYMIKEEMQALGATAEMADLLMDAYELGHLTTRVEDYAVIDRVMTKISNTNPDFFIFEYGDA